MLYLDCKGRLNFPVTNKTMITKQSFREATKLVKIWNRIIEWEGFTLATVQWHSDREWKVLEAGVQFDDITDRTYKPVAEFHTQEELWQYLKPLLNK